MLKLERKNDEVFCDGVKLKMAIQKNKNDGNGYPAVNIEGLYGSNGRKWMQLCLIEEGIHEYDPKPINRFKLTPEEEQEIAELKSKIKEIEEKAKLRYDNEKPEKPVKKTKKLEEMTIEEVQEILDRKKAELKKIEEESGE